MSMKPAPSLGTKVARVAVNVRLYFDVLVTHLDENAIRRAARAELERVEDLERIRITDLRFPVIYPIDDWPAFDSADIDLCEICSAEEDDTSDTRFEL